MNFDLDANDPRNDVGAGWARELVTRRVHANDPAPDLIAEIFDRGDVQQQAVLVLSLTYIASLLAEVGASDREGVDAQIVVQEAFAIIARDGLRF
jgi:hypothetical protein